MSTSQLLAAEDAGWDEVHALMDALTAEEAERPGYYPEGWSAKDLLGHIGSWLAEAGVLLERISVGTYRRDEIDVDAMNRRFFEAMTDVPLQTVRAQASAARTRMLQAWRVLPEPTPEAVFWIRKSGAEHYDEHLPRLREWAAELKGTTVRVERAGPVAVVTIDRPSVRNAVDAPTAAALAGAFRAFDADEALAVAVLTGAGRTFCAGWDLKAIAAGGSLDFSAAIEAGGPMGTTRMTLSKPAIAAIEGHAVGGGFELALWCDLRVAARDAVLGVFNRRFGVPLVDVGTVRLPRIVGHGRAMDLILTGRAVTAEEALGMGLVTRVVEPGRAREVAVALGRELARFPQTAMRSDRLSAIEQWGRPEADAVRNEIGRGLAVIRSGETAEGAGRFARGEGRHGTPAPASSGDASAGALDRPGEALE